MAESKKHLVSVAEGDDPYRTTLIALSRLDLPGISGRRVLIKPNIARPLHYSAGATTHPQVLAATIDHCRDLGAAEVVVGESPITGVKMSDAYPICGISEVAEEKKVPLLDFDAQPFQILEIPRGRVIDRVKVTICLAEYNYVISLPVMKTHIHTGVTLSLKNMKGTLWRRQKVAFHQIHAPESVTNGEKELDLAIADLSTVLYPDLAVIDGMIGMEGLGPGSSGKPKGAGLVVAGRDALAADWVACRLMDVDPNEVAHLKLAARYHGFIPDQVVTTPDDFIKWRCHFNHPPSKISFRYPGVIVHDRDSCSACQNTLFLFLERFHHRLWPLRDTSGPLHLAMGKGVSRLPQGTIYVGNCCFHAVEEGNVVGVPGCPPVASQIWEKVLAHYMPATIAAENVFQTD
ncbi:MAG: DUF362 domain-containing protein [Thermodesulfobacteriota bacterium]